MNLRVRSATLHLAGSAAVAAFAAWLVFRLWYPPPLAELAGGTSLFLLLVGVDVVMGPALTAVVASPAKPRAELVRDLAVIVALQLAAFGYGLHTMALARPAVIAFEVDRLRLVSANDVDVATLAEAPAGLRTLSWTGPRLLVAVKPTDPKEQLRTIDLGLSGVPLAALPRYWRPYADQVPAIWQAARPVADLLKRHPDTAAAAEAAARQAGVPVSELRFLSLLARRAEWVALIAASDARIVGYLPVESGY